jgi:DNA polymerase-3 subunit alpha
MLQEFPAQSEQTEHGELVRGLGIRLQVTRKGDDGGGASAELQLSDAMRFYPTDAALAQWRAQSDQGQAVIVYE